MKNKPRICDSKPPRRAELAQEPFPKIRSAPTVMIRFKRGKEPLVPILKYCFRIVEETRGHECGVNWDVSARTDRFDALPLAFVCDPDKGAMNRISQNIVRLELRDFLKPCA